MCIRDRKFCIEHPDKIIIATGDTCQLDPINEYTNTKNYAEYADECINQIFTFEIYLEENKRLESEEDKVKLKNFKKEILDNDIDMNTTIKKYFRFTQDITKSLKNIAYKNDTCKEVSKHIRKKLNKKSEYEAGEILICREYTNIKKVGIFNVNFKYKIVRVLSEVLRIKHITTQTVYDVPLDIIRKSFQFNYCATCHSVQGSTIRECITIFDWRFYYTSRKWIYTAVTRATNLNNVYFYDYVEPELNHNLITAYFNRKIGGYKSQDKSAGRVIPKDNYVTAEVLESYANRNCFNCGTHLYLDFKDGNTVSNITADRIDCSLSHTLDNIRPCCRSCNCSLSDKSPH